MKMLMLAQQMYSTYKEYNPSGDFLSIHASRDGVILISDCYFNQDGAVIYDVNGHSFKTIDCAKYKDGSIRLGYKYIENIMEEG